MIPAIAIPALVALISKIVLLGYSAKVATKSYAMRLVLALLVVFMLLNLVEFIGMSWWEGEVTPVIERLGFLYVALLIPAVALIVHASLRLSLDVPPGDKRVRLQPLLYMPGLLLLCLLFATEQLVTGFQPFRNTVLRVPGPLYVLFEGHVIVYLSAALMILVFGARGSRRSAIGRARNRLWLLGLLPFGLLLLYLIVANHYGAAKLTSTIYLPIPLTLFLIVVAYATHRFRLPDVGFFVPGSKIRRHKTRFYREVERLIPQIRDVHSVQEIIDLLAATLRCRTVLIGGLRPLTGVSPGDKAVSSVASKLSAFPREILEEVERMTVTDEVAESHPELHRVMMDHGVAAIVPFNSPGTSSPHWLLLGEHFRDQVYTPRDFRVVEPLFDRIGEYFQDSSRFLCSRLEDATDNMHDLRQRLALAWDDLGRLRKELSEAEADNRHLYEEKAMRLHRQLIGIQEKLPVSLVSGDTTLESYIADIEARIVAAAVRHCAGNETKAARLLGIPRHTLRRLRNT